MSKTVRSVTTGSPVTGLTVTPKRALRLPSTVKPSMAWAVAETWPRIHSSSSPALPTAAASLASEKLSLRLTARVVVPSSANFSTTLFAWSWPKRKATVVHSLMMAGFVLGS